MVNKTTDIRIDNTIIHNHACLVRFLAYIANILQCASIHVKKFDLRSTAILIDMAKN